MKKILKYLIVVLMFFCIEIHAQEAGKNSIVPSEKTVKGRRELRKDKRIKRHEKHLQKANEENYETKADKPFHKKRNRKVKKHKNTEEIKKKG